MSALPRYAARLLGTMRTFFHIGGPKGPGLKRNVNALEARLFDDSAYAVVRGGNQLPIGQNDLRNWASFAVDYYVDTATGNDANPGTQASPFATLNHALSLSQPFTVTTIHLPASQTFSIPAQYTVPFGARIVLQGTTASSAGARTCAAGSTTTVVNDNAATLVANSQRGDRLLFNQNTATVALRGMGGTIRSNTTSACTLFDVLPAVPAAGDTYTIQRASSVVQWLAKSEIDMNGAQLYADSIDLQSNVGTNPLALIVCGAGVFRMRAYRLTSAGVGTPQVRFIDGVDWALGTWNPNASSFNQPANGTFETGGLLSIGNQLQAMQRSLGFVQNTCGTGTTLNAQFGARLFVAGWDGINAPIQCADPGSTLEVFATPSGGTVNTITGVLAGFAAGVLVSDGAQADVQSTDISNWTGNGVNVSTQGYCSILSVTGSGNTATNGVVYATGGRGRVEGAGNTCAGAGGAGAALLIGQNAAVAFAGFAGANDFNPAATSQGCYVST